MISKGLALLLFLALAAITACRAAPATNAPAITPTAAVAGFQLGVSTGSSTLVDLVHEDFSKQLGLGALTTYGGNSGLLYQELDQGRLDAILVHYVPSEKYWFNPIALDGLVVILHPDLPTSDLSRGQVQALFSGRIGSWSDLGGPEMPVVPYTRERGSGARRLFLERIMAGQPLSVSAMIVAGDEAMRQKVASTPGAVGYSFLGSAAGLAVPAIDGILPTPATTADQSYPLTVPVYFVSQAEPDGDLRAFLAWLQAEEGQSLLGAKYGRVR